MQLLIVHQDAEVGEGLRDLVQDYAGQPAAYVADGESALAWAQTSAACDLLLVQLDAAGIDGFELSGSLGEIFPQLHTFFLPAYAAAAQPLEVAESKIFPEPIDGERLLAAIARTEAATENGDFFHLVDLLQMCCLSEKSGAVQMVAGAETGVVYLRHGELRHAATARAEGIEALYEMLCWGSSQFAYDPTAEPTEKTIETGWDAALVEIVLRKRDDQALPSEEATEPQVAASHLAPEPDLTGQQFGTYVVGRKLTESFWDTVYQAEQTSIGRQVVLHVLRNSLRENPERAQEFLDAASINANIRHPSILPVYEAGEFEGTYYYTREFVVGHTLYELKAANRTISALLALRIIRAVATAFAHLEAHGILHAPLRLSRIFVTPNEEARLAEVAVASPALAQLEPAQHEIQMLGRLLIPMTKATALPGSGRVLKLIHQMQTSGDDALTDWATLAEETKLLETLVSPAPLVSPRKTGLLNKVKFWGK
jgi:CheY-like chemotaxis protein